MACAWLGLTTMLNVTLARKLQLAIPAAATRQRVAVVAIALVATIADPSGLAVKHSLRGLSLMGSAAGAGDFVDAEFVSNFWMNPGEFWRAFPRDYTLGTHSIPCLPPWMS